MDEDKIRQIVKDEIAASQQRDQYNVNAVPVHSHNNIDSPNIPPHSVAGFVSLPGTGNGVIAQAIGQYFVGPPSEALYYNPASATPPILPNVIAFPIPVIYGHGVGVYSAFNGGDAPAGTVVFFENGPTLSNLWIKTENGWYGINADSVI